MIRYLTDAEIVAMHSDLCARFGGAPDIRDGGAIEAISARVRSLHYPTSLEKASALWESIATHRPFDEMNRRTGFAAAAVFLRLNGFELRVDTEEALQFHLKLEQLQAFSYNNILNGLRGRALKLSMPSKLSA